MYIADELKLSESEWNFLRSYLGYLAVAKNVPKDVRDDCASINLKLDGLATVIADLPPRYI